MDLEEAADPPRRARRRDVPGGAEGSQVSERDVGPGSVVAGRFRLEDLLEESGSARFWRATDLTLARHVAVHVLSSDDPRASAALTAARTSALVSDPHILRVLDAVEHEDVVFLVHEWGTGISLDQLLVDDVLDAKRAAWLVREVAYGIVAAHAMGVAHGRLIPENVLINEAGAVKLIGFVVNGVLHGRPATLPDGTPAPSEHESDVLNLGGLLYASLTGRWPGFPESQVAPAPTEHGHPIRLRRVKAGVPKQLDALCEDILGSGGEGRETRRPRYESAAAIAEALSRYLGDGGGMMPVHSSFTELGGPTAFVDPERAPRPSTHGTLGSYDGEDDPDDLRPAQDSSDDTDPEATRAGFALDDSAPGRAFPRGEISDSSAEARAQVDTEERLLQDSGDEGTETENRREKARVARQALGWRSDHPQASPDEDLPSNARADTPAGASADPTAGVATGLTAGAVPPSQSPLAWGPEAHATGSQPAIRPGSDKPGALALRLAAFVALVAFVVVAVLLAFDIGSSRTALDPRPDQEEETAPEPSTEPVAISQVLDLDPPSQGGNGKENGEDAPLAADGDPSTVWRTKTYFDGPKLAPYKQGLGLVVDLGEAREVREVELALRGQGYDVTLLAPEQEVDEPPTDIAGLQRLGRERATVDDVVIETDVTTRYLVVWFRSLPEVSGGYAGQVAEIVVRS